ncbi:MAG: hypothetical protein SGJ24_01545 [Chloroflexota bacterium]|nr:hypothetical protein [Chloroflexota bacterium]
MIRKLLQRGLFALMIVLSVGAVYAGERTLSQNSGTGNAPFFISGEPTLILNGFDLNSIGITRPAVIDRVSIAIQTPIAAASATVVVYQDANGGSPSDATLVSSAPVTISSAGVFTAVLPTPATITAPVVWVGFYLPVGTVFLADTSGTSVLTWWAWTPGTTFDVNQLGSAAVLGPADGTAPVGINMNGKARITLEITGAGGTVSATPAPGATSAPGASTNTTPNASVLAVYALCSALLYDTADEQISYQDQINLHCREVPSWQAPFIPAGYTLRGVLYDVVAFKANGVTPNRWSVQITHCIRPAAEDIDRAVIGSAYGNPRTWAILPSARVGDLVCAEVRYPGALAYFVR